eukprot:m.632075 g.632075  ORF g.632075 m.632075 type:complete len:74 (-) comp58290_c0_seq3:2620-2841(-)
MRWAVLCLALAVVGCVWAAVPPMTAAYATLGVRQRATMKEITSRYRMLVKKYHPDKNKEPDAQGDFLTCCICA